MLLVLSEEHKEHLSFLTQVDVEGKLLVTGRTLGILQMGGSYGCMASNPFP